jgi:hypothetical protein
VLIGACGLTILGAVFAIFVSIWISVVMALIYFAGLFVMISISNKRSYIYEKKLIFNMGLVLMNLNNNKGEIVPSYSLKELGIRLEAGYLA